MTDREIDALVAEKVMGWQSYIDKRDCWVVVRPVEKTNQFQDGRQTEWTGERAWGHDVASGKRWDRPWWGATQSVPEFSTDIAAAFFVVEAMRAKGFVFEFEWWPESENSAARFTNDRRERNEECDEWRPFAASERPARAICLAALKALGVEVS